MKPEYKYYKRKDIITKDGHTMFLQDVVKDLKYLQSKVEELEEKLNTASCPVDKGYCDAMDRLEKQNKALIDFVVDIANGFYGPKAGQEKAQALKYEYDRPKGKGKDLEVSGELENDPDVLRSKLALEKKVKELETEIKQTVAYYDIKTKKEYNLRKALEYAVYWALEDCPITMSKAKHLLGHKSVTETRQWFNKKSLAEAEGREVCND